MEQDGGEVEAGGEHGAWCGAHLGPLFVARQQRHVDQVRVRQEDVAPLAQLAPIDRSGVAVERGGQEGGTRGVSEFAKVLELVLSECLGREEEHCGNGRAKAVGPRRSRCEVARVDRLVDDERFGWICGWITHVRARTGRRGPY